jgi:hypothetical protein
MLVELLCAGWMLLARPASMPVWMPWAGAALLAVIWLSTALLQVPRHAELGAGFAGAAHSSLVVTNWLRTAAWSARAGLSLWMIELGGGPR